jgi:hypothetical protein
MQKFKEIRFKKAPRIANYVVVLTRDTADATESIYTYCRTKREAYRARDTAIGRGVKVQFFKIGYVFNGSWEGI